MIGPIENNPARFQPVTGPTGDGAEGKRTEQPRAADRVEISREARERAAELDNVPGLSAEQVAEIRHRIVTGAYDAPEVIESIARRMIDFGEF